MDVLKRVPVREQEAEKRAANFEEVCLGYNKEEAMCEASRCINCRNAQCIKGCPVAINIPGFIEQVKNGDIEAAYQIISQSSALPAVCGREWLNEVVSYERALREEKQRYIEKIEREAQSTILEQQEIINAKTTMIDQFMPTVWYKAYHLTRLIKNYLNRKMGD